MIPDDTMTDERWSIEAESIGYGWLPGRVFCGCASDQDGALGWTKGAFGIFEGIGKTEFGRLELSSLTHLKSGRRIALFATPDSAVLAAGLAERVGDWSEIDADGLVTDQWKERARHMYTLWRSAGLVYGPLTCAGKGVWAAAEPVERQEQ